MTCSSGRARYRLRDCGPDDARDESRVDDVSYWSVGGTCDPSTYLQRVPIVAMSFVGLLIVRVLAAYQLGYLHHVWARFFASNRSATPPSSSSRRGFQSMADRGCNPSGP